MSKEAVSYCPTDVARIEASGWKACQGTITVEAVEEVGSYCGNVACIKTSSWQIGEGTINVEGGEEVISYTSSIIAKIAS